MSIFLAHTAKEFADDYCILFLDGAGWHRANNLRVPSSMKLIFLPPYSPELNPVETLWEHIRENYFKNLVFDSLDEAELILVKALHSLYGQADLVKSMVNYHWLNTLCLTSN
jgi:transposase